MWCRFLTFCVLVSFVLFVVASCIYGRPSFHLFFHRCCGDDIENDQVIYENFGNNFLKERLVGGDIIEADSDVVLENEEIAEITDETNEGLSINDPEVKKWIANTHISEVVSLGTGVEEKIEVEQMYNATKGTNEEKEIHLIDDELFKTETENFTEAVSTVTYAVVEDKITDGKMYTTVHNQKKFGGRSIREDLLEKGGVDVTARRKKYLNVHDSSHRRMVRSFDR